MRRSKLSITQRHENGWLILSLDGNVDASTFQNFEEELTRLAESGAFWLRLELHGLRSINSTGLGLLITVHRQLRQNGGRLELRGLSPQITSLFNLLGLSRLTSDEDEPDEGAAGVVAR